MTIRKTKATDYVSVTPSAIAYDIQVRAAYIAEKVNTPACGLLWESREEARP